MDIREKAAYLKGLIEGSDLQMGSKERKIFDSLIELVSDMAQQLQECDDDLTELFDEVDELEEEVLDIEDDLDILFDVDDELDGEDDFDEEEDPLYEIECPSCHEKFSVDEDTVVNGDVRCPFCGEKLEFEIFEDEDEESFGED